MALPEDAVVLHAEGHLVEELEEEEEDGEVEGGGDGAAHAPESHQIRIYQLCTKATFNGTVS